MISVNGCMIKNTLKRYDAPVRYRKSQPVKHKRATLAHRPKTNSHRCKRFIGIPPSFTIGKKKSHLLQRISIFIADQYSHGLSIKHLYATISSRLLFTHTRDVRFKRVNKPLFNRRLFGSCLFVSSSRQRKSRNPFSSFFFPQTMLVSFACVTCSRTLLSGSYGGWGGEMLGEELPQRGSFRFRCTRVLLSRPVTSVLLMLRVFVG